jgi:hypothetical protein
VKHPPVTFVCSHARRGGQQAYLTSIVRALDPDLVQGVVALQAGPALPGMAATGARVWVLPTPGRAGIPRTLVRLRRLLVGQRAKLVHADGPKSALCAALATTGSGIPVLWMRADGAFDGWVARAIARRCAMVVGMSQAVLSTFDGLGGPSIQLVRGGVPDYDVNRDEAGRALRELLGAGPDAPVVAHVARVVANKGQLDTVEAAGAVLARHPDTRFAFIGDTAAPEYADEVRSRARELGVEVAFLGYRDDAVRLIAGADALVVPSLQLPGFYGWREGFGLVAAEAMAVGTPVVAYDDPAIVETLAGAGALVPSGDRRALAEAITKLLDDPDHRRQLAEAGRRRAAELRFDRSIEELTALYASIRNREALVRGRS